MQQDVEVQCIPNKDYSLLESDAVEDNRYVHTNFTEDSDASGC
jgi:hypothetical protein